MTSIGGRSSWKRRAIAAREMPSASFSSSWIAARWLSRSLSPSSLRSAADSSPAWPSRIAASRLRLGRRLGDAVDHERLGDRLDAVDDVVEARHQLVDVLAVERRDEGILEPAG